MGRDFFDADPEVRKLFAWTSQRCGRDLERLVFSGPPQELGENLAAQASVYLVSTVAARFLAREGVAAPATAGYSLGNYAALVATGAISYEDGLDVLIAVWRESERLQIRGAMITGSPDRTASAIGNFASAGNPGNRRVTSSG